MKLQLIAKYEKKIEGGPLGDFEKVPKKILNEIFEQCQSAEKCRRGPKYRNKRRGDPLVQSKKNQKSPIVSKKIRVKNTKRGILCFRDSGHRCFCFGRFLAFRVCFGRPWFKLMLLNKKVDLARQKKLPTVRVGQIFY